MRNNFKVPLDDTVLPQDNFPGHQNQPGDTPQALGVLAYPKRFFWSWKEFVWFVFRHLP